MVGQKQKQKKKHAKPLPHICLWAWIILLMVVSCALSLILFPIFPAWSAILASICAGCVTGIIFYLLTNMRNKVVLEEKEEYESIEKYNKLAKNTWDLCLECIVYPDTYKARISRIKQNVDELSIYMGTMFIDAPKTAALIEDFPADYVDKLSAAQQSIKVLSSFADNPASENDVIKAFIPIIRFCQDTHNILIEPMVELMCDADKLNRSIL